MTRGSIIALAALAAVTPATAHAGPPATFTLEVSPTAGGPTDTFVATIQIELVGVSGPERVWEPDFDDFTVLDTQVKKSTSMTFDQRTGKQELRTHEIRRYFLRPRRSGTLRIGPAALRARGTRYETDSATVKVGSAAGRGAGTGTMAPDPDPTAGGGEGVPGFVPPDPSRRDPVFLHAVADDSEVYVGEQVIVSWLLYTRSEVLKFEPEVPSLDKLWSEVLYEPDSYFTYHDTEIGDTPYAVTIVSKRALFPTAPGKLEIQPYGARVTTLEAPLGRAARIESEPVELEVKPLPGGAPRDFDPSYVGVFEADARVDRRSIDAGESFTLTLTVTGEGAIRRTSPPRLDLDGFEVRVPRDYDQKVETSGDRVRGERVYRYWTTPQRGGEQTIPAIELTYFNPATDEYEQARTDPIPVVVHGDPSAIDSGGEARENVIRRDIRLIREGSSVESRTSARMYRRGWFWIVAAVPPLAFVVVFATDRVREGLRKETPRSRLRRARGRAQRRLRVAEIHLRGQRPAQFFGELARVLYEHVEERVGRSVQSMTHDELAAFLTDKGFARQTVTELGKELENCDFARFAPSASGPGEMRSALRRTRELLKEIERTRLPDDAGGEEEAS